MSTYYATLPECIKEELMGIVNAVIMAQGLISFYFKGLPVPEKQKVQSSSLEF